MLSFLPYLNGQDLNTNFDQSANSWIINFLDWPLNAEHDNPQKPKGPPYASDYPDCLDIVRNKVKPEREKLNKTVSTQRRRAKYWWIYGQHAPALYEAIKNNFRVLIAARVSKLLIFSFVPKNQVFSEQLVVFSFDDFCFLALLQSSIYTSWAWEYCSTMRDAGIRFSPTDGFETFPFPENTDTLETIGETYYTHRQTIMQTRQEGLTKTYNRFHDPTQTDPISKPSATSTSKWTPPSPPPTAGTTSPSTTTSTKLNRASVSPSVRAIAAKSSIVSLS